MLKKLFPITLFFMYLNFGCEETKRIDNIKEKNKEETYSNDAEFWKEIEWDVKKITLISFKNGIDINKTKDVLNLYFENYRKWIIQGTEDSNKYEIWINQEINKISATTSLTVQEVAKIIWEWEIEECY